MKRKLAALFLCQLTSWGFTEAKPVLTSSQCLPQTFGSKTACMCLHKDLQTEIGSNSKCSLCELSRLHYIYKKHFHIWVSEHRIGLCWPWPKRGSMFYCPQSLFSDTERTQSWRKKKKRTYRDASRQDPESCLLNFAQYFVKLKWTGMVVNTGAEAGGWRVWVGKEKYALAKKRQNCNKHKISIISP